MADVRRRALAGSVWIPLRRSETIGEHGSGKEIGDWQEVDCVGAVAMSLKHRAQGDRLGWSELGLLHHGAPCAVLNHPYKPADVYLGDDQQPIGAELILQQNFNGAHDRAWLVSQDLVMALGLLEEGDYWLSVNEGYTQVIRRRRDAQGSVISIEIKAEFLRDYLAAREMALRVVQYRQRMAVFPDRSQLTWPHEGFEQKDESGGRFCARVVPLGADGDVAGGSVAVIQTWRTDVDPQVDVPVMDRENDANTAHKSFSYARPTGAVAYRASGELWREEWIEPAPRSVRVRGADSVEQVNYIVNASGHALPARDLNKESVGRWLWFRPQVIEALLAFRGSGLAWYTRETGAVKCSPDDDTHFGVNQGGMINVYAYDIARLPLWQQRIWGGFNVTPDGPVCAELMEAQMQCTPAKTRAPEQSLIKILKQLNDLFTRMHGRVLFRSHPEREALLQKIHRFRGLSSGGVLSLAKDLARVTADAFDVELLRRLSASPAEPKLASLKLLEAAIAQKTGPVRARVIAGPLFGIYNLRLGDAHPPSSDLADAFELAGVDANLSPLKQAVALLDQASATLTEIHRVFAVDCVPAPPGSSTEPTSE